MTFLYPTFLWLLIPVLALLFTEKRGLLVNYIHIIILIFIVLSLSRPIVKGDLVESEIEAKEIIVALDVSYSMHAKDIYPTRYDFAKESIENFLQLNIKDNIMLIAFTTNPLLLSPPTTDHKLIATALKSLNPEYILTKGTSLKRLFSKIATFKKTKRTIILISDGGEGEDIEELTAKLKKEKINLIVLGLGTKEGSTIEKSDGTLIKDSHDNLVVTRLHPMLKEFCLELDGVYMEAYSSPKETAKVLQKIFDNNNHENQKIMKKQYKNFELYYIPLLLALLLFTMLHTKAIKYLVVLFLLMGVNVEASIFDGFYLNAAYKSYELKDFNTTRSKLKKIEKHSLQSQFALANSYYKLHMYKKAIAVYSSILSTSPKVKQKLYYNLANAYVKLGQYDEAKSYYIKSLHLGEDKDALYNLRIVTLLKRQIKAPLGITNPKSQSSDSSKSQTQNKNKSSKQSRDEDKSSSGASSGEEGKKEKNSKEEKSKLLMDKQAKKQPISSKVYELINKGYIYETQPW